MSQDSKVSFTFKEIEPNLSTVASRFNYFFGVTNPQNFFVSDEEVLQGVATIKKFKQLAKESPDGVIQITQEERAQIVRGKELMDSHTNDVGELVFKPFRMCGFVPINIPILCGIVLSAPTVRNTVFFQWLNQSYNAGLNFGNKNSTCTYTNTDLAQGYLAAVSSSITVGVILRKLTAGLTQGATGKKLLLLNTLVGCTAGGCASFCNTACMRRAEVNKGIKVYQDENLENYAGISKVAAQSAVQETAISRACMSIMSTGLPAAFIIMLGGIGIAPKNRSLKNVLDITCIALALGIGLPGSVSIFPPVSVKKGK